MKLEYSMLDRMGETQEVILGEYLLFSGTIPVVGIQVSLFMRPIIEYIPTLYGNLDIIGPATASPSSLRWNHESVTSSISFTDTKPVSISLSNPKLILNDLKVNLEIYAIIMAVTVSTPDIELVNLGDYSISSSSVNLISYDPNYFALYTKLQESYLELDSRLQEIDKSLTTLNEEINDLKTTITTEINSIDEEIRLLDSKIETYITKINNLTAEYDDLKSSVTDISQRVASIESQVDQLISQPRNQQIHIIIPYILSIGAFIIAFVVLILLFKK